MKSGFSTGNGRKDKPIKDVSDGCDLFLNFAWTDQTGECRVLQFHNQRDRLMAAEMLRKMAAELELND